MPSSRPTRIVFVTVSTALGGAEKTLWMLARGLDRSRFEPAAVICLKPEGAYAAKLRADGIPVESLGMGRAPCLATLRSLRERIAHLKPDVVHAFLYTAMQTCRAAKALGDDFPLLSSPRVTYRTRPAPLLAVDALLRGQDDLLVAESEASRRHLLALGYAPEKVRVIRNGLPEAGLEPASTQRAALRASLGAREGDVLLGAVGRLDPQKGQKDLLKALALLPERFRLALVGGGPDRAALERAATTLGLGPRVSFLGEQPQVGPYLAAFDLFVHPALWEGTPNAVMEAMAAGLPVVATRVDGVEEIVEDGRTGRLVPPGDPEALSGAVRSLADRPERARALAEAACRRAADLSLPAMIAAYEAAYQGLRSLRHAG